MKAEMTPKVLFIGGYGRSGSTLLDRVLGRVDGFFSAGEVRHLWIEGLVEGRRCGCGVPVPDCPVWQEILEEAFGSDGIDVSELLHLRAKVDRFFRIPQFVTGLPRSFGRDVERYARLVGRLYRAIAVVTGASVIVDSSKDVSHGWLLTRVKEIDLHVVQLVRDSRATAYSWRRKKFNPGSGRNMDSWGIVRSALEWSAINSLTHLMRHTRRPFSVVRYEDLAAWPAGTVSRVLSFVGEGDSDLPVSADGGVELDTDHTVAGNPLRFDNGAIRIRPDVDWVQDMGRVDKALVGLLTYPSLHRYGFDLRPAGAEGVGSAR
ncbi:MAG: sulfotransferase domain-containing protein [Actinomycetota bacterium]